MSRAAGAIGFVVVLVAAGGFAVLNGGQRVTLDLGFVTFYRVPLTFVAFGGIVVGMLVMLAAGARSDLKVRSILRERFREEGREERERVDRYQRDLFEATEPEEE